MQIRGVHSAIGSTGICLALALRLRFILGNFGNWLLFGDFCLVFFDWDCGILCLHLLSWLFLVRLCLLNLFDLLRNLIVMQCQFLQLSRVGLQCSYFGLKGLLDELDRGCLFRGGVGVVGGGLLWQAGIIFLSLHHLFNDV